MPSTSATKRLQAFRTMEHRANVAERSAKSLRAELAALRSSSERQTTSLRAEVDRQRVALAEVAEIACVGGEVDDHWKEGYAAAVKELRAIFERNGLPLPAAS